MQQVMSNTTNVMVDDKQGGNLLYLPLDNLIQAASPGAPQPEAAPAQPASTATAPAAADPRSRDNFRSRDREARP